MDHVLRRRSHQVQVVAVLFLMFDRKAVYEGRVSAPLPHERHRSGAHTSLNHAQNNGNQIPGLDWNVEANSVYLASANSAGIEYLEKVVAETRFQHTGPAWSTYCEAQEPQDF